MTAFRDLREFAAHLERAGRLRRVTAPVSRYLEILQNHPEVVMVHAKLRRALDQL